MRYADPLAQAEIDRLQAEIDELKETVQRLKDRAACRCQGKNTGRHRMPCKFYVGPVGHVWVKTSWNGTFGGVDHWCSCGGWFRQGGLAGHGDGTESAEAICPKADVDWQGPKPDLNVLADPPKRV